MTEYILEMFGISLILTLLIELLLAYAYGLRGKLLSVAVLVNILTNPAAVLLHWLGIPQIPIEIAVIAVEGGIYLWFSDKGERNIKHPMLFSAAVNLISWSAGLLITWFGGSL